MEEVGPANNSLGKPKFTLSAAQIEQAYLEHKVQIRHGHESVEAFDWILVVMGTMADVVVQIMLVEPKERNNTSLLKAAEAKVYVKHKGDRRLLNDEQLDMASLFSRGKLIAKLILSLRSKPLN